VKNSRCGSESSIPSAACRCGHCFAHPLVALVVIETARIVPAAKSDRSPSGLLALLIAISLASDFLMVLAAARIPTLPIVYFPFWQATVGCTLAQGCLLAAWLAWGSQPFWQRALRHWIVAAILYLVWVAGLWLARQALGQPDQFRQVSMMVGLSVPLMSIAAQLPLWMARQMFGWRLIHHEMRPGEENKGPRRAPLSIRDLMTATVVVAVALALARLAPSPDGKPIGMLWVIMFTAATTVSTMTLLPVGPLLMRTPRLGRGVLLACLYAAFWIGLLWLIVLVAWGRGLFPPPPLAVLIGLSFLILSFAATVVLAAAAARSRGYRLISGRLRHRSGDV
jgi:hypothetical protein